MNIDNMIASQRSSSGDMLPSVFRKQCKPNHGVTRIHKEDKCSIKIKDTKSRKGKEERERSKGRFFLYSFVVFCVYFS